MNKAERAKSELAKLTGGMPSEVAAYLVAEFEKRAKADARPLAALRASVSELRKTHERQGEAWAKREAAASAPEPRRGVERATYGLLVGDIDGDGDTDFACRSCMSVQPEMCCALCAAPGPGRCCVICGNDLDMTRCLVCKNPYIPVSLEEEEEGAAMRLMNAAVAERTTSKTEGRVRLLVNTSKPDDWNTILPPSIIASRITPADLLFDIDHQICRCTGQPRPCEVHGGDIDGVRCETVSVAKVPWRAPGAAPNAKPEIIEATVMDVVFDLTAKRAKMLYDGIPERWPAASVEFTYPKAVDDAVMANRNSGKPLVVTDIHKVKRVTFTAIPSNDAALVTEIRTSRQFREPTKVLDAQQKVAAGEGATIGDALREAVDSIGKEAGDPSAAGSPTGEPSAPPADAGGGAPELSLKSLSDKLDTQVQAVEAVRTSLSKEVEARLAPVLAELVAVRVKLEASETLVASQRTQIDTIRTNAAEGILRLHQTITRMRAVPPRVGSTGAEKGDALSEALRTIPENERRQTAAEEAQDAKLAEAELMGRIAVPL